MSQQLLLRTSNHIITDGGLLAGYALKYYRWSDADLNGSGNVVLFRMSGTGGESDSQYQQNDVSMFLLSQPQDVTLADAAMLAVLRYLRADFEDGPVSNFFPLRGYTGPNYLSNDRAMFEMVIRCGTEDH